MAYRLFTPSTANTERPALLPWVATNRTDCDPLWIDELCTRVFSITPREHKQTTYSSKIMIDDERRLKIDF